MSEKIIRQLIGAGADADRDIVSAILEIQKIGLTSEDLHGLEGGGGLIRELPDQALVSLARALALVDAMPGLYRGAVAPVIGIMRELSSRLDGEEFYELAHWIQKHDPRNHYLPLY